jgi:hypothetical protein
MSIKIAMKSNQESTTTAKKKKKQQPQYQPLQLIMQGSFFRTPKEITVVVSDLTNSSFSLTYIGCLTAKVSSPNKRDFRHLSDTQCCLYV